MSPAGPIEPSDNLQGLLLVAHPTLRDPNFRRTVLFVSAHEADSGTLGLVLNRPLERSASHLLPDHEQTELLARIPVYLGGPVGQDQLSFADLHWDDRKGAASLSFNLSLDDLAARAQQDPSGLRAFVGYAGWSAGQLREELEQKAWVLTRPEPGSITLSSGERLWRTIMNSFGPDYKLLAAAPDDPSVN